MRSSFSPGLLGNISFLHARGVFLANFFFVWLWHSTNTTNRHGHFSMHGIVFVKQVLFLILAFVHLPTLLLTHFEARAQFNSNDSLFGGVISLLALFELQFHIAILRRV
jgi:hypothetical protein